MNTLIIILVISILFFIFYNFYYYDENEINNESDLLEYKISKHNIKSNKITNKFNIKEFDSINDNIIVHNKFKNELLEYKAQKELELDKISKLNKQKNKKLNENLNRNIEIEKEKNLVNKINILKVDIKSLTSLLKEDLKNILNDIKQNKLSKKDKLNLKAVLLNEINKTKELYNNANNHVNNNKFEKLYNVYQTLLQKKIDILDKKYKIYLKILN